MPELGYIARDTVHSSNRLSPRIVAALLERHGGDRFGHDIVELVTATIVDAENGNHLAETSAMTQGQEHEAMVLDVLKRAVAEALERKRKLGQYAVVWRDGRVFCIGPDAPAASGLPSTGNPR